MPWYTRSAVSMRRELVIRVRGQGVSEARARSAFDASRPSERKCVARSAEREQPPEPNAPLAASRQA